MDEQASFDPRAVLPPRRARMARLALLLPAVALAVIAWSGISGGRSDETAAGASASTDVASPSVTVEAAAPSASTAPRAAVPAQVLGLDVQRLDDVRHRSLGRDDVVAIAGWYVATAITDCPRLAALYRDGALPNVRGDVDELAFCERSGVLSAGHPDADEGLPGTSPGAAPSRGPGPTEVSVTLVVGVIVPMELEIVGGAATEVVVVGRFVDSDGCRAQARCPRELVVDHVAWTAIRPGPW